MDKFEPYVDSINGDGYVWKQPWIENIEGECSRYTVTERYDGFWVATWWHGNRGYQIGRKKTPEEAKKVCVEHLRKMYKGIATQLKEELEKAKKLTRWLTDKLLEHEEIVVIRRGQTFKVYLDGEAAAAFSSFARELMKEDSSAITESRRERDEER